MDTNHYQYLRPKPGSFYRQLFVNGRIRADTLYSATVPPDDPEARTPEQVAADFDLPLEAVQEAIHYCETHADVLAKDYAREERLVEARGMNHPGYKYDPKKYYRFLTPQEQDRILGDEDLSG